jgi:hypothetical protein
MGRECNTNGVDTKCVNNFGPKAWKEDITRKKEQMTTILKRMLWK